MVPQLEHNGTGIRPQWYWYQTSVVLVSDLSGISVGFDIRFSNTNLKFETFVDSSRKGGGEEGKGWEEGRKEKERRKGGGGGRRGREEGRGLVLSLSHDVNIYLSRQRGRDLQRIFTHAFFVSNNKQ